MEVGLASSGGGGLGGGGSGRTLTSTRCPLAGAASAPPRMSAYGISPLILAPTLTTTPCSTSPSTTPSRSAPGLSRGSPSAGRRALRCCDARRARRRSASTSTGARLIVSTSRPVPTLGCSTRASTALPTRSRCFGAAAPGCRSGHTIVANCVSCSSSTPLVSWSSGSSASTGSRRPPLPARETPASTKQPNG